MSEQAEKSTISVGDLFEIEGRSRTFWTVEAITKVPRHGILVRLSEIDGLGRVTIPAIELGIINGFRSAKQHSLKS
ncbi:hypothetical protein [Magnetospirillum molischianum]|uniref:Uncharacterized protein n=1 Tax=Magnetospirillum molischianum DSM 120 TaxID=1150626 RepID=H8FX75_MAGML|nr:hypothetical protein [Magnetospirillum molischianum]CCG42963.1 hypothetical protein PHAMO_510077 [Magnetospirillum molischianum DSM 120]